jgi:hypothetical protein
MTYKIDRGAQAGLEEDSDGLIVVRYSPISGFFTVSLYPFLYLHVPVGPKPDHEVLSYSNNKQAYNLT